MCKTQKSKEEQQLKLFLSSFSAALQQSSFLKLQWRQRLESDIQKFFKILTLYYRIDETVLY